MNVVDEHIHCRCHISRLSGEEVECTSIFPLTGVRCLPVLLPSPAGAGALGRFSSLAILSFSAAICVRCAAACFSISSRNLFSMPSGHCSVLVMAGTVHRTTACVRVCLLESPWSSRLLESPWSSCLSQSPHIKTSAASSRHELSVRCIERLQMAEAYFCIRCK